MKESLIQIYLLTYELGRSTNMILNTDENPLLTLHDMFYFYCMYLLGQWSVPSWSKVDQKVRLRCELVPTSLLFQAKVFGDDIRANVLNTRMISSIQLEQKVFKEDNISMIEASIVLRSKIAPTDNCFQLHLLSCQIISVQAKVFNWFHEGFDWMLASLQINKARSICWNDTINCSNLLQFVLWRQF